MFSKMYEVGEDHIDFQEVVDGLYYPFYMEWARHAFMKEALGIDIEGKRRLSTVWQILIFLRG
ncbi:hypothetical protein KSGM81_03877 [Klebsiella quasipneumoniae]|nr:hypothetical protein KSGM81_03877 [Klebsiella quasipneumoniae]